MVCCLPILGGTAQGHSGELQALGKGEADDPTPSGQPNNFRSDGRDAESKAMRGGANEGSFYTYVVGNLAVGALLLLAGFVVTWAAFFSRNFGTPESRSRCWNA